METLPRGGPGHWDDADGGRLGAPTRRRRSRWDADEDGSDDRAYDEARDEALMREESRNER